MRSTCKAPILMRLLCPAQCKQPSDYSPLANKRHNLNQWMGVGGEATPSTAGTFRKKFRKSSESPRKRSLNFPGTPLESTVGNPPPPNPIIQGILKHPEHFQNEGLSEPVMEFAAVLRVSLKKGRRPVKAILLVFVSIDCLILGQDMGEVQNVWGEENAPKNAPSRSIFGTLQMSFWSTQSWIFEHEKHLDGGNNIVGNGV